MVDVRVAGVGMTHFGKFPDRSPRTMAREAIDATLTVGAWPANGSVT